MTTDHTAADAQTGTSLPAQEGGGVAPLPNTVTLQEAGIAMALGEGNYLLDGGRVSQAAPGCLLQPQAGDRVLVAQSARGDSYLLQVLSRSPGGDACLNVPGADAMVLRQSRITLNAGRHLALGSLGDIDLTTTGVLRQSARNLFTTVSDSLVENVRHYVGQMDQHLLRVKKLLRLHGEQVLLTAEKDVKVDGERISMG